jgi:phenylacetate-CoA ligase
VGEIVVTSLNPDYPLIRFGTGDMSAYMPGMSPCGRTNSRIKGWMGRADQTTKFKGVFVRPEQVAELVGRLDGISRARVIVGREGDMDVMSVKLEGAGHAAEIEGAVVDVLKLRGAVEIVGEGSLPRDGVVIEDQRSYT